MPCRNKAGVYSIIATPFCLTETGEGSHNGQPRCLSSLNTAEARLLQEASVF